MNIKFTYEWIRPPSLRKYELSPVGKLFVHRSSDPCDPYFDMLALYRKNASEPVWNLDHVFDFEEGDQLIIKLDDVPQYEFRVQENVSTDQLTLGGQPMHKAIIKMDGIEMNAEGVVTKRWEGRMAVTPEMLDLPAAPLTSLPADPLTRKQIAAMENDVPASLTEEQLAEVRQRFAEVRQRAAEMLDPAAPLTRKQIAAMENDVPAPLTEEHITEARQRFIKDMVPRIEKRKKFLDPKEEIAEDRQRAAARRRLFAAGSWNFPLTEEQIEKARIDFVRRCAEEKHDVKISASWRPGTAAISEAKQDVKISEALNEAIQAPTNQAALSAAVEMMKIEIKDGKIKVPVLKDEPSNVFKKPGVDEPIDVKMAFTYQHKPFITAALLRDKKAEMADCKLNGVTVKNMTLAEFQAVWAQQIEEQEQCEAKRLMLSSHLGADIQHLKMPKTCPECNGSGEYTGLHLIELCSRCKGKKVV